MKLIALHRRKNTNKQVLKMANIIRFHVLTVRVRAGVPPISSHIRPYVTKLTKISQNLPHSGALHELVFATARKIYAREFLASW